MVTELQQNGNSEDEDEIAHLEQRLAAANLRQHRRHLTTTSTPTTASPSPSPSTHTTFPLPPSTHFLLLLSDSALPLGSFAFSSGLESHLAHLRLHQTPASFTSFLPISISSYAATTLPYLFAAHRDPGTETLVELDDALDATLICTVGRRASVAQGRALLGIWERSFAGAGVGDAGGKGGGEEVLKGYAAALRRATASSSSSSSMKGRKDDASHWASSIPSVSAHLAPLFGAIASIVGLSLQQTAYVFMLGHVKALVSAAVRAGMFGPYQAQGVLAGSAVQGMIAAAIEREWETRVEEAGQTVPVMDLWVGRHECLYSRIFNS